MNKYLITVNGNKYEVEVEEITGGETVVYEVQETAKEKLSRDTVPVQSNTATSTAAASTKPKESASSEVPSDAHTVTAPMPGVILAVNVNTGDTVKRGDVLLILEAMKMENEIVAPTDGNIVSVNVEKGASVNVGDILVFIG